MSLPAPTCLSGAHGAEAVVDVRLGDIQPSPENAELYRPVDPNDPDVRALAESIARFGIREPLVITQDHFILSGHRRHTSSHIAGLSTVPCRIESVVYAECDADEFVRLLREYNRQRVKSLDEQLREEVVSADPHEVYESLLAHRHQQSDMSDCDLAPIEVSERRGRKRISQAKREMLSAVRFVVEQRREYWPLSDRQIHYVLLNDPPRRNTRRPDSRYANDRTSYGDLCDLLTRARLYGLIPWRAISDDTRPTTEWRVYAGPQDFLREELEYMFRGYARDLQRSQPNHIEIVAEKLTVRTIVERVASRYALPVTIGRGYCSITPRYQMAQRFRRSGKDRLVLLILSDFDPDGETIAESFARSMRDDFGVEDVVPIKAALTADQVRELQLRPDMQAKRGSSQYRKFVERHGTDVFELEAIAPEVLEKLLTETIELVLDTDLLEREIDQERKDATFLEEARQRANLALRDL